MTTPYFSMGQVLTCKLWASPQQSIALQGSLLELDVAGRARWVLGLFDRIVQPSRSHPNWTPAANHVT
jgi:hypothetical protein